MDIWVVRTRTTVDWEQLEGVLPQHLEREGRLAETGELFLAGPLPTADGGLAGDALTLFHTDSAESARTLAEQDPFMTEGIRVIVAIERWDIRSVGRRALELFDDASKTHS